MKRGKSKSGRKAGRPPAGRDERGRPVPVSTAYKKTTLRLRPSTKAALDALATIKGEDRSTIVEEALAKLISSLSPAERKAVELVPNRRS